MQVFEFYFNPKAKEDAIYDSFIFEPENFWERKMGSLYMAGSISNLLPQNTRFLENLSSQIKKEYYRVTERQPEISLKESLRKANEFLAEETKTGNVSWLGNLDFAVISLKENTLYFTTTGDISLFILRGDQITDVNQTLRLQEIEPYPLKIFGNIVSGKLLPEDRIAVLTKEAAELFTAENLLLEIARLEKIEEKQLKKIFQVKEGVYLKTSGIFLLVDLGEEATKERITLEKRVLPISIWRIFRPFSKEELGKLLSRLKPSLPKIKGPTRIKFPTLKLPVFTFSLKLPQINVSGALKRNSFLILILILILLLGGFFTNLENKRTLEKAKVTLTEVEAKIQSAREVLILGKEKEANLIYQAAWDEISPLAKIDSPVKNEAQKLKDLIESQLLPLNELERIDNPELIFDFKEVDFTPQKMVEFENNLYLISPLSDNIYQLVPGEKKGNFIKAEGKFNLGAVLENRGLLLFFSRPNKLVSFEGNQFRQAFFLQDPYPDYQFGDFTTFGSNLYFLDGNKGEILRYLFNENRIDFQGNLWLNPATEKPIDSRSLTVDGSVWILTKDYGIEKYTAGSLKEKIEPSLFPYLEKPTKIFTTENLSYLYILEPAEKRLVILDKKGGVVKQFQSDEFNNLKDFSVAVGGRTVYVLNGVRVYKVVF